MFSLCYPEHLLEDVGVFRCLLAVSLSELLFGYPVTVVSGKGYVEVKLLGVNKGKAVEKILKTLTTLHGDVDFVLCIGDDRHVEN